MSVMNRDKKKAVFLDRDGVLCEDTDYVTGFDKLHIFPYAREAVRLIHQKGYLAIVVTNQSGIARGMMTEELVKEINQYLKEETGVDEVYYCPHLPPEQKEIFPYRIFCDCRKPKTGMLRQAEKVYDIDMEASYMVGDRVSDIQTGRNAGAKTVYLSYDLENIGGADYSYKNLLEFSKKL